MGRGAAGVRGVRLTKGDKVVGAVVVKRKTTSILVVAEHGFGKRSDLEEYRISHRGGKGVFTIKATEKTGKMVAIKEVLENDDIVVVTSQGVIIRQPAKTIRIAGRNTQGVRLIRLDEGDRIAAIAIVRSEDDKEVEEAPVQAAPPAASAPVAKEEETPQATLFDKEEKKEEKKVGKKETKKESKGEPKKTPPKKTPKKKRK